MRLQTINLSILANSYFVQTGYCFAWLLIWYLIFFIQSCVEWDSELLLYIPIKVHKHLSLLVLIKFTNQNADVPSYFENNTPT